jgi:hypothetical protein
VGEEQPFLDGMEAESKERLCEDESEDEVRGDGRAFSRTVIANSNPQSPNQTLSAAHVSRNWKHVRSGPREEMLGRDPCALARIRIGVDIGPGGHARPLSGIRKAGSTSDAATFRVGAPRWKRRSTRTPSTAGQ